MIVENAVNHGGHSEHDESQELMLSSSISFWAITRYGQERKLLAVSAVFAVVI